MLGFGSIPNAKLIVVSILPCPESDDISKSTFTATNQQLKNIASMYSHVEYLNISKAFAPSGIIDCSLYKVDQTHLNFRGAEILAKLFSDFLRKLFKVYCFYIIGYNLQLAKNGKIVQYNIFFI